MQLLEVDQNTIFTFKEEDKNKDFWQFSSRLYRFAKYTGKAFLNCSYDWEQDGREASRAQVSLRWLSKSKSDSGQQHYTAHLTFVLMLSAGRL